jgi:hypothetical protein
MKEYITESVVEDNSDIVVTGKDMFGAAFSEKAKLISLSREEISLSLFRPVSENAALRVNFHPDASAGSFWVKGKIIKVKIRLDGMQTVGVKILNSNVQ